MVLNRKNWRSGFGRLSGDRIRSVQPNNNWPEPWQATPTWLPFSHSINPSQRYEAHATSPICFGKRDALSWKSTDTGFIRMRRLSRAIAIGITADSLGYLILRLPHNEVMADMARAVTKIRDMVKFRRDSETLRN